jgi:hypothetical protein
MKQKIKKTKAKYFREISPYDVSHFPSVHWETLKRTWG